MAYGTNKAFGLRPSSSKLGGSWNEKTSVYNLYTNAAGTATEARPLFQGDPVQLAIVGIGTAGALHVLPLVERYSFNQAEVAAAGDKPATFGGVETATIVNTQAVAGVFSHVEYRDTRNRLIESPHWVANTPVYPGSQIRAYIYDDPMTIFEMQVSTSNSRIADAIFAGDYTATEARQPSTGAYFSQSYTFGLGGTAFDKTTVDNMLYPNAVDNEPDGDTASGISRVYLNLATTDEDISGARFSLDDDGRLDGQDTDVLGYATNYILAARAPLKVMGFVDHPQNEIFETVGENRFVRPFLNVRVMINNHVAKPGAVGQTPAVE